VRVRVLRGGPRLLALARQRHDGTWGPTWIWREGEAPRALGAVALRRGADGDGWVASLEDGTSSLTVASGRRLHRHAPLEELGLLGRLIGAVMEVPVTYTYRCAVAPEGAGDGLLEVSLLREE
jgi:hypothetical protein